MGNPINFYSEDVKLIDYSLSNHQIIDIDSNNNVVENSRFGVGAGFFEDSNDYLDIEDIPIDWQFATGDFTIDFWAKFVPESDDPQRNIIAALYGATGLWNLRTIGIGTDGVLRFSGSGLGMDDALVNITTTTWHHIAIVGFSSTYTVYFDGTSAISTAQTVSFSTPTAQVILKIGRGVSGVGVDDFRGYIDELRISKGTARWTANFTPPTSAYTPDVYDVLLMHFDELNNPINFYSRAEIDTTNLVSYVQFENDFSDSSPYNSTPTLINTPTITTTTLGFVGAGAGSFDFDDYVTYPVITAFNIASSADYLFHANFSFSATLGIGTIARIFGITVPALTTPELCGLYARNDFGEHTLSWFYGGVNTIIEENFTFNVGSIYDVVVKRESEVTYLILNSVTLGLNSGANMNASLTVTSNTATRLYLGEPTQAGTRFEGVLDDFYFINGSTVTRLPINFYSLP